MIKKIYGGTEKRGWVSVYYAPEIGVWARGIHKILIGDEEPKPMPFEKLPKHLQEKLPVLLLTNWQDATHQKEVRVPGLGAIRKSKRHESYYIFKLYGETWNKPKSTATD